MSAYAVISMLASDRDQPVGAPVACSLSAEGVRPRLAISVVRTDVASFYQHLKSKSRVHWSSHALQERLSITTWSTWSNMNTITHPLR